ncbi:hypothetical protein CJO94_01055 [Ralstonia solanacearum]|nr:hypothetical protein CJO94_01055 [Ralstonia solanacearum]
MNAKPTSVAARIAELGRAPMPERWRLWERKAVVTADRGFEYEGKPFKSLTALARHITGRIRTP